MIIYCEFLMFILLNDKLFVYKNSQINLDFYWSFYYFEFSRPHKTNIPIVFVKKT